MHKLIRKLLGKLNIAFALVLAILVSGGLGGTSYVLAVTSSFTQTINPGTLSVNIVDGSYNSVSSPSVAMSSVNFSFACQTATGYFGTSTPSVQLIYVQNPDAADSGWKISLAASNPTDVWDSAGTDFDFNEAGSSGCVDDGGTTDTDSLGGQMTVNPTTGEFDVGQCSSCNVTGISLKSSYAFIETTRNSIDILEGAVGSNDIGDWKLEGVTISQKIPAEQPAASDYNINMMLTIATL